MNPNTPMKPHPHAELMRQYAEDAAETDKPWERWECIGSAEGCSWTPCILQPNWDSRHLRYRRRPRTININGIEVPEPMREEPEHGDTFYTVPIFSVEPFWNSWDRNNPQLVRWFNSGLCHATREAAELHAKALLSFTAKSHE